MPWLSVNHTGEVFERAVPRPFLALDVHRPSIPGAPGAKSIIRLISLSSRYRHFVETSLAEGSRWPCCAAGRAHLLPSEKGKVAGSPGVPARGGVAQNFGSGFAENTERDAAFQCRLISLCPWHIPTPSSTCRPEGDRWPVRHGHCLNLTIATGSQMASSWPRVAQLMRELIDHAVIYPDRESPQGTRVEIRGKLRALIEEPAIVFASGERW